MTRELVQCVGERRAPVIIGSGILDSVAARVRTMNGGVDPTKVLIVCDGAVDATWGQVVADSFSASHATRGQDQAPRSAVDVTRLTLHASEANKSIESWQKILAAAIEGNLDRKSLIVAVGGGIVTDLAGFAAASYLRGIQWLTLPTTLLGMVDAALGGKTGINLSLGGGALGKNLAGAFWPPSAVICDVATLSTLPVRDFRAGLAECFKHAMIADASIESLLATAATSYTSREAGEQWRLIDLVARSAAVKLAIVARDPREQHERMVLNLGHTFAHAIESQLSDEVLHGEAVALGLVAASFASAASGRMTLEQARSVRARLAALGFAVQLPRAIAMKTLKNAAGFDKKRVGKALTLVLPLGDGGAQIVHGADGELLRAGFAAIGAVDGE